MSWLPSWESITSAPSRLWSAVPSRADVAAMPGRAVTSVTSTISNALSGVRNAASGARTAVGNAASRGLDTGTQAALSSLEDLRGPFSELQERARPLTTPTPPLVEDVDAAISHVAESSLALVRFGELAKARATSGRISLYPNLLAYTEPAARAAVSHIRNPQLPGFCISSHSPRSQNTINSIYALGLWVILGAGALFGAYQGVTSGIPGAYNRYLETSSEASIAQDVMIVTLLSFFATAIARRGLTYTRANHAQRTYLLSRDQASLRSSGEMIARPHANTPLFRSIAAIPLSMVAYTMYSQYQLDPTNFNFLNLGLSHTTALTLATLIAFPEQTGNFIQDISRMMTLPQMSSRIVHALSALNSDPLGTLERQHRRALDATLRDLPADHPDRAVLVSRRDRMGADLGTLQASYNLASGAIGLVNRAYQQAVRLGVLSDGPGIMDLPLQELSARVENLNSRISETGTNFILSRSATLVNGLILPHILGFILSTPFYLAGRNEPEAFRLAPMAMSWLALGYLLTSFHSTYATSREAESSERQLQLLTTGMTTANSRRFRQNLRVMREAIESADFSLLQRASLITSALPEALSLRRIGSQELVQQGQNISRLLTLMQNRLGPEARWIDNAQRSIFKMSDDLRRGDGWVLALRGLQVASAASGGTRALAQHFLGDEDVYLEGDGSETSSSDSSSSTSSDESSNGPSRPPRNNQLLRARSRPSAASASDSSEGSSVRPLQATRFNQIMENIRARRARSRASAEAASNTASSSAPPRAHPSFYRREALIALRQLWESTNITPAHSHGIDLDPRFVLIPGDILPPPEESALGALRSGALSAALSVGGLFRRGIAYAGMPALEEDASGRSIAGTGLLALTNGEESASGGLLGDHGEANAGHLGRRPRRAHGGSSVTSLASLLASDSKDDDTGSEADDEGSSALRRTGSSSLHAAGGSLSAQSPLATLGGGSNPASSSLHTAPLAEARAAAVVAPQSPAPQIDEIIVIARTINARRIARGLPPTIVE
jgi:hypothetical protein